MARDVLEADVPCLSHHGVTDPYLCNFTTKWQHTELHLQTSPEFGLKRLLADGIGDCYYLGKAFRNEAAGPQHSPEFLMLEWYRCGFSPQALMAEIACLVTTVLDAPQPESLTYHEAFLQYTGLDIWRAQRADIIAAMPAQPHFDISTQDDSDLLQMCFALAVEPHIGQIRPCFVTDFPLAQAALAKPNPDGLTAARFELYYRGMELANGYGELTDAAEQQRRFEADNAKRRHLGLPLIAPDTRLLKALERGLPECSGVALGVDRLVMLACGATDISEVQAFASNSL